MFRRAFLSASSAAMGLMAAALAARSPSQQPRQEPEPPLRRSSAKRRAPKSRPINVSRGAEYLRRRSLHPGRSSSIRKLQRAFRLAGTHFVVGTTVRAKGRGR